MSRIQPVDPATATGRAQELLDAVQRQMGVTPNLMRTLAHSPAALEGYLNLNAALAKGALSPRLRQQLALDVAEANGCGYCLSAHTAIGRGLKMSDSELDSARDARSEDARAEAALRFARTVLERRGAVGDADLQDVRAAGYTDGEIAEIVGAVAVNVFTNYFNLVADTAIDFPPVAPRGGSR